MKHHLHGCWDLRLWHRFQGLIQWSIELWGRWKRQISIGFSVSLVNEASHLKLTDTYKDRAMQIIGWEIFDYFWHSVNWFGKVHQSSIIFWAYRRQKIIAILEWLFQSSHLLIFIVCRTLSLERINDKREECGRITQYSPSHREFGSRLNLNFTLTSIPFKEKLPVLPKQHKSDEDKEGEGIALWSWLSNLCCPTFRVSKTRNIARYGLQWLRYYLNSSFFFSILVLPSHMQLNPLSPTFLWSWRMVDRQKRRRQKHFEILKMTRKHAGQIFGTYRAAWVSLRQ